MGREEDRAAAQIATDSGEPMQSRAFARVLFVAERISSPIVGEW